MITFKQFISESFDTPVKYRSLLATSFNHQYEFVIDDQIYEVNLMKGYIYSTGNYKYHIAFQNLTTPDVEAGGRKFSGAMRPLLSKDPALARRVFSTVGEIIRQYFRQENLSKGDRISFISVHSKTQKIYEKFAKQIAREIGGELKPAGYRGEFTIVKK